MVDCKDKLKEKFGEFYDEKFADILSKDMTAKHKALLANADLESDTIKDLMTSFGEDYIKELERKSLLRVRQAKLNILKYDERLQAARKFKDPFAGIEAGLVGTPTNIQGAGQSAETLSRAIEARHKSAIYRELDKELPGARRALEKDAALSDAVGLELFEMREGGSPGSTKNPVAKKIADIYSKEIELLRREANDAGADIRAWDGHIIAQSHNPTALTKAGFDKWKADILPLLDRDLTFGIDDVDEFLRTTYTHVKTGIPGTMPAPRGGRASISDLLARHRKLHFRDGAAFIEYNRTYGNHPSIADGLEAGIHTRSKEVGLMKMYGPDPRRTLEAVISKHATETRAGDKPLIKGKRDKLMRRFDEVSGQNANPQNLTLAAIGSTIRNVNTVAHLGMSVISSFNDFATVASNAQYQGMGFFTAFKNIFTELSPTAKKKGTLELLDEGLAGTLGFAGQRFTPGSFGSGMQSKAINLFFRLNGLQYFTDSMKAGSSRMLANYLATAGTWDALVPATRKLLQRYGIGQADWKVISKSATVLENGKPYLTPNAVQGLTDLPVAARNLLEDKMRGMFIAEADISVVTPGARERSWQFSHPPGTVWGEAARMLLQFKQYPVSILTKVWPRLWELGTPGIVPFAMMSLLLGYASSETKNLIRGRTLRDPFSKETWLDAAVNGGAGGLYFDVISQDLNGYGGALERLSGPGFGMIAEVLKSGSSLFPGFDPEAAGKRMARLGLSKIPFGNLYFAKSALDYMLLHGINESLSPGYLRRMESRARDMGQEFFLPPSQWSVGR